MSSMPTHSNSGSLNASTGPVSHSSGGSFPSNSLGTGSQPSFPPWVNGNSGRTPNANRDAGSPPSADEPKGNLSETSGGIRSPITTDESLIECLEQRLLERETELQELQVL